MDWITNAWATIEPYFMKFIDLLVNSGIGALIGMIIVKKWEKKHNEQSMTEAIASNVTNKMVGRNILVSLESVNKDQINNLIAVIKNELNKDFEIIKEQAEIISGMARIMLRFKAATEEEKAELLASINKLETTTNVELTVIKEQEPVVIEVGQVEDKETAEDTLF